MNDDNDGSNCVGKRIDRGKSEHQTNDVINLLDDSEDYNGSDGKVVSKKKKRKIVRDINVIDLIDDGTINETIESTQNVRQTKKKKKENKTNKKGQSKAAGENSQVIDLIDSGDDYSETIHDSSKTEDRNVGRETTTKTTNRRTLQQVVLDSVDNARITHGMTEQIHTLLLGSRNLCWTCLGSNATKAWPRVSVVDEPSFGSPSHIQQTDTWSCGYRNYQMLLSALLPRLMDVPHHSVFSKLPRRSPPMPVGLPSVLQIQAAFEDAWNNEGFDVDGAKHYRYSILHKTGNRAKIGAMEVANLCWYHGIDAVVVQFVKCIESRRLLPWFVLAYFLREFVDPNAEAARIASANLYEAEAWSRPNAPSIEVIANEKRRDPKTTPEKALPLLPLYLQWEGHSVTIIGIEYDPPAAKGCSSSFVAPRFLVLDPLKKSPFPIPSNTTSSTSTSTSSSSLPSSVALPWEEISQKDLQIVVCTERSMPYTERQACRSNSGLPSQVQGRVLTAAQEAVQRHLRGLLLRR